MTEMLGVFTETPSLRTASALRTHNHIFASPAESFFAGVQGTLFFKKAALAEVRGGAPQ